MGRVYDVTRGKSFYGPGAAYGCFAGRDATVGLAKSELAAFQALDDDKVQEDQTKDIAALTPVEKKTLKEWVGGSLCLPFVLSRLS